MKICPYCSHHNLEGIFLCEECGQVLYGEGATSISTKRIHGTSPTNLFAAPVTIPEQVEESPEPAIATAGAVQFAAGSAIVIHISDQPEPIVLRPQDETILGRYDGSSKVAPTVDLTPYGAYEKGVSRVHAIIRRTNDTLALVDLGSANGTQINGQRLAPNQPRPLRDGDEIRLGKLVCRIYFK